MKILLASQNKHKIEEISILLKPLGYRILSLLDFPDITPPEETGITFEENALIKAVALHQICGGIVVADDSGLEVDALGGLPGVRSKRYSAEETDEANNKKLLEALKNVPPNPTARFVCAVGICTPQKQHVYRSSCEGTIRQTLSGSGGFGYDPLFCPNAYPQNTMAELSQAQKNSISHRGLAFQKLPEILKELLS
ncbi:MAG: non-canonical purine NTP pyrophosphatase, RdgB/HAM1 family [Proteobacteria bacterium]|nr:non-canonical purine NTP pyrophosphatase, RdgB/HAM1 family [Pseudomonadota bacterium]